MAKTKKYTSIEPFIEHIRKYHDFISKLNSKKLNSQITVSLGSEILSSGREILYEFFATAQHYSKPFAEYRDDSPRIHNNLEDGQFDIDLEKRDFSESILKSLQEKKLPAGRGDLEIKIETKNP